MLRLPKFITKTLSVRISLIVIVAMTVLLMASLAVMLHYARKTVKEESIAKASQSLEGLVQSIDNILLSVEQASGNIYFRMLPDIDHPDLMYTYSRKLVESNPFIEGCAIAFKENFYKDRRYFMAYARRSSDNASIERVDTFGDRHYLKQVWVTAPMKSGRPEWLNPLVGMKTDEKPVITFCLPIYGKDGKPAGVMGVDVSLNLLSRIVADVKPSVNSYCTLLDHDGSFIVHPDGERLMKQTALTLKGGSDDSSIREVAQSMISGETDYRRFQLDGAVYYIFYKPFRRTVVPGRAMGEFGWSAGIIYPEDDIFGDYKTLLYYVIAITIVGLLLMFVFFRMIIRRQLNPLLMLAASAQRIGKGNYDELIPESRRTDEIGRLQNNFRQMQQTLASNIGELEHLKNTLEERGVGLREAYQEAQKANRMKTSFLHNVTNQMIAPSEAIYQDVEALCDANREVSLDESRQLVDDIQENGNAIAEVLGDLINMSDEEIGKEAAHV